MSKITLTDLVNLENQTTAVNAINANNAIVETAFDNTLSRDGTAPNQMAATLDMNGQQILNLPAPATPNSALRLQDLLTFNGSGTISTLPTGGSTGQMLSKNSATNFDVGWADESAKLVAGTNISLTGTTPVTIATSATPTFATSVNTPVVNGGALAGSTLSLKSTSSGAPSGDSVTIQGSTTTIRALSGTSNVNIGVAATTGGQFTMAGNTSGTTVLKPTAIASGTLTLPAATDTLTGLATTDTLTGVKTFGVAGNVGKLVVAGNTSGSTVLNATAIASGTLTLPAATDTLVGKATVDVLTNKTFNTAGTGNVFQINGVGITANTGTGSNVLATSPTLVTPVLGAATATTINGVTLDNTAWTTYTPTSAFGTPGTSVMGTAIGRWKQIGKTVFFSADCTVTTVGTGTGNWNVGLPTATQAGIVVGASGKEVATLGVMLGVKGATTLSVDVTKYDNTSIALGGNGSRIIFLGTYEAA